MKFAIINASGTQFKVREGDTITIDRIGGGEKKSIQFSEILLLADGDAVSVGAPYVAGASVTGTVLAHKKGEKVRVATYKSKARTRRVKGHRSYLSDIKINTIGKSSQKTNKGNSAKK